MAQMNARKVTFDGLEALEITTSQLRMVVVTQVGPRIAFLGKTGGDNLFYWKNDDQGREGWKLRGGHRVWATRPLADESEDAYAADNEPCQVETAGDVVRVTGAVHPFLKTARGVEIRSIDAGTFQVTNFVTNCGPMLYSGGVWALTCTNPSGGKTYGIPLGDRSKPWDLVEIIIPRAWDGHTSHVDDPQVRLNENFMIVKPEGVETKRMLMAPFGILAMTSPEQNLTFIKRSPYNPEGRYPLGCNLAIYVGPDNFMVEMETCAAERTVMSGETIVNSETWKVVDETFDWQSPERLVELMK